jgi:ribose transport system permease protein
MAAGVLAERDGVRASWVPRAVTDRLTGQSFGTAGLLVAVVIGMSIANSSFVGLSNIRDTLTNASILAIVALGETFVIATAGLDLSVGAIQMMSAVIAAQVLNAHGSVPAVVIALLAGAAVGLTNGAITTVLRVPAFMTTLGSSLVITGLILVHLDGASVLVTSSSLDWLARGRVLGVPTPVLIGIPVALLAAALLKLTRFGRYVIALGGNRAAAVSSGVRVARIQIAVYGLSGLAAGICGLLLMSQLKNVDGTLGQGLELQAIAVTVLGGTSLVGGRARLGGTCLAAALLSAISAALNILNIQSYYQYLATGALLILALAVDAVNIRRASDTRPIT